MGQQVSVCISYVFWSASALVADEKEKKIHMRLDLSFRGFFGQVVWGRRDPKNKKNRNPKSQTKNLKPGPVGDST